MNQGFLLSGCFPCLIDPKQQKDTCQKEKPQKDGAITHAPRQLGNNTVQKSAYDDANFFCNIIKAEKRSGVGGIGQKLGISGT